MRTHELLRLYLFFNLIITPENIFYFIYFAYSEPPQKWPLLVWSEAMNSY